MASAASDDKRGQSHTSRVAKDQAVMARFWFVNASMLFMAAADIALRR